MEEIGTSHALLPANDTNPHNRFLSHSSTPDAWDQKSGYTPLPAVPSARHGLPPGRAFGKHAHKPENPIDSATGPHSILLLMPHRQNAIPWSPSGCQSIYRTHAARND